MSLGQSYRSPFASASGRAADTCKVSLQICDQEHLRNRAEVLEHVPEKLIDFSDGNMLHANGISLHTYGTMP